MNILPISLAGANHCEICWSFAHEYRFNPRVYQILKEWWVSVQARVQIPPPSKEKSTYFFYTQYPDGSMGFTGRCRRHRYLRKTEPWVRISKADFIVALIMQS